MEPLENLLRLPALEALSHDSLADWADNLTMTGSLSSTTAMKRLKTAEIPLAFLGTFVLRPGFRIADVIPSSVEHMSISGDLCFYCTQNERSSDDYPFNWERQSFLDAIMLWLAEAVTSYPHLATLVVKAGWSDNSFSTTERDELLGLGETHGITIEHHEEVVGGE
ncbi:hypothetical protein ANO11243_018120 [Dothideomycetidae sp. 11243]|nr:hypothetical protein ANO11243_018120 [fungal sp. No.11243]